jgi:putative ABC transport system permease protein
MFKNYLLTAYRNIIKNKVPSVFNIVGLSVGMFCFIAIYNYFISEQSYDRFHKNGKNIYRVVSKMYKNGEIQNHWATSPFKLGQAIQDEFPEVIACTKICRLIEGSLISYDNIIYRCNSIGFVDSAFFKIFSFPMIKGDPLTAMIEPNSAVITKSFAKKIFGKEDPMGKTLEFINDKRKGYVCLVKGVIEDFPSNSHIKYDILVSYQNYINFIGDWVTNWPLHATYTYIQLKPGTNYKELTHKLPIIVNKYLADFGKKMGRKYEYYLQPIYSIHLHSHLAYDSDNGSADNVYFLLIAGIFILIISWVNYINLTTAKAMERAKEISVRKIVGCKKTQIIKQIICETALLNIVPIVLSIALYQIFSPFMQDITGVTFIHEYFFLRWGIILLIFLAGTLLSAVYPALVLSSYKPALVLKGKFSQSSKGLFIRKVLTTIQFVIASFLIIFIIFIYKQILYIRSIDLGVDIKNTIIVNAPIIESDSIFVNKNKIFKEELEKYSNIFAVATSASVPGKDMLKWPFKLKSQNDIEKSSYPICEVDYDYFNIYKPKFLAGRNFSEDYGSDNSSVIITKSSLKMLGLNSPNEAIGKIILGGNESPIIGVIDDYHHLSLKNGYFPILFFYNPQKFTLFSVKLKNDKFKEGILIIQKIWKEIFPDNPLEYKILQDFYYQQYKSEYNFSRLFAVFTIISIIIVCLGLFSLSYYDISLRTKEICIRKIFGSSILNLFGLLSKSTLKICIYSLIIAWAAGYYFVNTWLQNFAFHINISILVFVFSGMIILIINILTISYNILRVANINPARIIKDE